MKLKSTERLALDFISRYRSLIIVNIVFLIFAVGFVYSYVSRNEKQAQIVLPLTPSGTTVEALTGAPIKVVIPKISVNAAVEVVGKTEAGNMAVPRDFAQVGWYKFGAKPGEVGNAVFAGHFDNAKGAPGVFYNLTDLEIGDSVVVEGNEGEKVEFRVTGMQKVDYLNPPPEILSRVFGTSTKSNLVLITCDGTWIQAKRKYSDRFIVFAEKIEKVVQSEKAQDSP